MDLQLAESRVERERAREREKKMLHFGDIHERTVHARLPLRAPSQPRWPRHSSAPPMRRAPPGQPGGGGGGANASPLDALANAIGVQGQIVEIPAVASIPGRSVPTIHLILLGAATLFFGWRVLAVAAVLHVISGLSGAGAGAGAAPRPR